MPQLFAERALLPDGWRHDVRLEIDVRGDLAAVIPDADPAGAVRLDGPVIPGMANLHSHAFQRAMAGLAEHAAGGESFWTWRQVMYRFVSRLTPGQVEAIAAQLYVEMLKAGYTTVGEFHYLHHAPDGRPYDDPAEMAWRVLAAARQSGIACTLLPVLYGYGGFGGRPAGEGQRRFLNPPDRLLDLVARARAATADDPQVTVGLAPHSLRAVTPETLQEAVAGLTALDPAAPIHIHVAEQAGEVEDCLAWSGQRPVTCLLEGEAGVDGRWCLIHATHATAEEVRRLAATGAVAGLCPTTEANLGDGLFPAGDFLDAGGRFGIGSDSHVSVSPVEELRWLEYGQRLRTGRRGVLARAAHGGSVGATLLHGALDGGARAMARPIGRLEAGCRADLVVLDARLPALVDRPDTRLLDAVVFAGNDNPVRDVMAGGRWVVTDRRHAGEEAVLAAYRKAVAELLF